MCNQYLSTKDNKKQDAEILIPIKDVNSVTPPSSLLPPPPPHLLVLFVTYFFYFLYVEEIVDLGKFTCDGAEDSLLREPIQCRGGNYSDFCDI